MDFSSPAFKVNIFFYSSSLFKVNFYTLKKTIIFLIFVHDFLNVIISHIQRIYLPHIRQGSSFFTLYERILKERQRLQKQIDSLQTKLSGFPSGKLICSQTGNRCKWYQSDGHTKVYIPKEEKQLAEQLAAKKYLSLLLEDLSHEKKAIDFYLNHHFPDSGRSEHLLTNIPGYKELLSPFFLPKSQELSDWMTSPYEHNTNYSEQLILKTLSGNLVRSKSEVIIDMALYTNQIPFRYECALHLGDTTLFPDFTIRHPESGELYYWEHFGRMDDPLYYKNVFSKLQLYTSHGIIPSINLITTYETKENPLSSEVIEKIIEHYFR